LTTGTPPEDAVILFGGADLSAWHRTDGSPATWEVADGVTTCNHTGSLVSNELFEDCYVHVEFLIPAEGPGNSGVYLQGRYEIQVLAHDYPDLEGEKHCGAIYNLHAPLQYVSRPRLEWQSFEVIFRAPRFDAAGEKTEHARMTLLHNGRVVQNNVEIPGPTGGHVDENEAAPGPLMLQDHGGNPVSYRNVWALHLPRAG